MPQSLAQVLVHIVFSTKNREEFIDDEIAPHLFGYLANACTGLECQAIKTGGYMDHVHILCGLSRKIMIMDFIEEIKKKSSKWIKTMGPQYSDFYWQDGYAIFSVSPKEVARLETYIERQKHHHSTFTYQDECRKLFRRHGVDWDERYVWG